MLVRSGEDDSGMMSEMNVTPLVDVMLVLLIVFIVTAPMLIPQNLEIQLPRTESVSAPVEQELSRLLIKADGGMSLDGRAIKEATLKDILQSKAMDAKFALQVEADEELKYGNVAEVMAIAQGAGVSKMIFVTVLKK